MSRKRAQPPPPAPPEDWSLDLAFNHREQLEASGIAPAVASERGYQTVAVRQWLIDRGFSRSQARTPTLLIPLWGVSGEIAGYQLRPDDPRMVNGKVVKYETPRSSQVQLDIHPRSYLHLGDPQVPLIVTEGVKKGDSAATNGMVAVALLGVWNWRGTNDLGGRTALAAWEKIALNGRKVGIAFDSDVMEKQAVYGSLARLGPFLESRGARVNYIYLPAGPLGQKVGLDDYFASGQTPTSVWSLAEDTLRPSPFQAALPEYIVRPGGISWIKSVSGGTTQVALTNFAARITADISEDDGSGGPPPRVYELEAELGDRTITVEIPAAKFAPMNWPLEALGAEAIVEPGMGLKDRARVAIQKLSGTIPRRKIFIHTGWTTVDGEHVYLHGAGALGTNGPVEGLEVRLGPALSACALPDPPQGEEQVTCIRAVWALRHTATAEISWSLIGAAFRAPLGGVDFSVHLHGPTGVMKTELAALVQSMYGSAFTSRNLPASWMSTANALEATTFTAKDMLIVVDDFNPIGALSDRQRMHLTADRLFRSQGNQSGRGRLSADLTMRPQRRPRGLILSTGEEVPAGQSLRGRVWLTEVARGDVDEDALTQAQADASSGRLAGAMAWFLTWLAPTMGDMPVRIRKAIAETRLKASGSLAHKRTPDIIANLMLGIDLFIEFSVEVGAISEHEGKLARAEAWDALGRVASGQAVQQAAAEPALRFLELLQASIASGQSFVAGPDGGEPSNPARWGWEARQRFTSEGPYTEWAARGRVQVGWVIGNDLYLEPDASFQAAQQMARDGIDGITVSSKTLHKRLRDKGLLRSMEESRGTLTIRKDLQGDRRSVLHLSASAFAGDPAQSAQSDPADPRLLGESELEQWQVELVFPSGPNGGSSRPPGQIGQVDGTEDNIALDEYRL